MFSKSLGELDQEIGVFGNRCVWSVLMEVIPDDLIPECLLRVPYTSHEDLKAVCRKWKAIVSNRKFYAERKISGTR
jgi:hypothetical protein